MDGNRQTVVQVHDVFEVHTDVRAPGEVTLTLVGELDHLGVGPLAEVLARTWEAWPGSLTLDLRRVGFINARGLGCLLAASRTARSRGVPLVLRCGPGPVTRLIALAGLGGQLGDRIEHRIGEQLADQPEDGLEDGLAAVARTVLALVPDPAPTPVPAPDALPPAGPRAVALAAQYAALVDLDIALALTGADVTATREVVVAHLVAAVPGAGYAVVCGVSGRRLLADPTCSSVAAASLVAVQLSAREGPTDDARRLRQVVHVGDLHRDGRWPRLARQALHQDARSVLAFPLVHEGQLCGVLTLHSDRPDAFDPAAQDLGGVLAARAATALGAARIRAGLAEALRSRDVIGQGKGILMARYGLTAPQAFALLSRTSQERNVRVVDLADDLARTGAL